MISSMPRGSARGGYYRGFSLAANSIILFLLLVKTYQQLLPQHVLHRLEKGQLFLEEHQQRFGISDVCRSYSGGKYG